MRKKGGNFFEEHVEKMVLVFIGLICIWLLVTRVFISPNKVEYGGEKLGPGEIDIRISKEAELLRMKLDDRPKPLPAYKQRIDSFAGLVDSPIGDIDISLYWPLPIHSLADISDKRKYRIPWIGEVTGATVEYIRAVAYVPMIEIDEENRYDAMVSKPNDIDFVTVEASFDVAGLRERFYDSFAGEGVEQEDWRDPCLAMPVFAAVQLQRQELGADGSLGEWQVVPRTKIDSHKKMFESLGEVEELPAGGIKIRLLQFDDAEVRIALLQPEAYKIASAKEEWFPPTLHKKYIGQLEAVEAEKKLRAREAEQLEREEEREKERKEREEARDERRSRTSGTGTYGGRSGDTLRRDSRSGTGRSSRETRTGRERGDRLGDTDTLSRREEREQRELEREMRMAEMRADSRRTSLEDIYKELEKMTITKKTDLKKLREPLTFWAHDDTVEPGNSYRYRIRLGVFNPIAGTNRFVEDDGDLKNRVVLWSEFSEAKELVKVPEKLYFFPQDVQEAARIVKVQVSRYTLGYWYSRDFMVKSGEVIGKVVDYEPAEGEMVISSTPETIDYGTGAVMVDVVAVNDWSSGRNMYARRYFDMLYTLDGNGIEHIPVSTRYWDEELRVKLNEIITSQNEPKEPLRLWESKPIEWQLDTDPAYDYERITGRTGTSEERRRTTTRRSSTSPSSTSRLR
jgi:hypothetical protein